jgi:hypothetical protein
MNKNLLIIKRNLLEIVGMLLHLPGELLELLLEVEFCLMGCALLVPVLGLEGPGFVHWQLLNGKLKEALIQPTRLRLQDVEDG